MLRPITGEQARAVIRAHHYSGKTVNNSNLHIGVYFNGGLEGAMQLGPPLDKRKLSGLVAGTAWDGFMELNRLAFSHRLPRNSESRALSVLVRVLRRHAPAVKWIVSFADATQCGDGAIYRAAGFDLTAIKPSVNLARFPDGQVVHKMTCESSPTARRPEAGGRSYYDVTGGRYAWRRYVAECGGMIIPGHQLRYIRFIDPAWRGRLTVPIIPFGEIERRRAGMYRGEAKRFGAVGSPEGVASRLDGGCADYTTTAEGILPGGVSGA